MVAPFLALGGFIAASYFAADNDPGKPALPLSVEGDCLPHGEGCTLKGIRLVLRLRVDPTDTRAFTVSASRPLEGITLQIVNGERQPPQQLHQVDALHWRLEFHESIPSSARIRIAAGTRNAVYFGEISLGGSQ